MTGARGIGIRVVALAAVGLAALFVMQCGTDEGPEIGVLTIVPGDAVVQASSGQAFSAEVDGIRKNVSWYVNGVEGGTPGTGLISTDGFYVAPAEVPGGGEVTLRALAVSDSMLEGFATVTIERADGTVYVTVSPDTLTLMTSESTDFSSDVSGCASDSVVWSLARLWGSSASLGTISGKGFYQAPTNLDNDFAVAVRATSFDCPGKIGLARVLIYVGPKSFSAEFEAFTSSYNVPGSVPVAAKVCNGASGGSAVEGLDRTGEWIIVPVEVPSSGTYQAFLRYSAPNESLLQVAVGMEGAGTPTPEASFILDKGNGFG